MKIPNRPLLPGTIQLSTSPVAHGLRRLASLTEELPVSMLVEIPVLIATFLGLVLGAFCIYWARVRPCPARGRWGCRLFIATLLGLGAVALFAAFMRADG